MEKQIYSYYTAAGGVKETSALASTLQVQLLSVCLLPAGAYLLRYCPTISAAQAHQMEAL